MENADPGSMRVRVLWAGAVGLLLLVLELVLTSGAAVPEPTFERDVSARDETNAEAVGPRLHVALVSYTSADAVVLDAMQTTLVAGEEFEYEVGFLPAESGRPASQFGGMNLGLGSNQDEWRNRVESSRELPPQFGHESAWLQVKGLYLGEERKFHGLRVEQPRGYHYGYLAGGGGGGTWYPPRDHRLLRCREPVVTFDPSNRTAQFLMLTDWDDPVAFDAGKRESWLQAFEAATYLPPAQGKAVIEANLDPELHARTRDRQKLFRAVGYGPAAELLTAAIVLHDAPRASLASSALRQDGALERALAGTQRDPGMEQFYIEHWDTPRQGLMQALVHGALDQLPNGRHDFMLLKVADDVEVARRLVDRLCEGRLEMDARNAVLEREYLGASTEIETQYERLREHVIGDLPWPWGVVLQSAWSLALWVLFVPIAALVFVLCVRPKVVARLRPMRLFQKELTLLGIFGFVTLCEVPLWGFLIPVWWGLAWFWLRTAVPHGVAERAIIWLGLSLTTIEGLHLLGLFVDHALLEVVWDHGQVFCWCLVGFIIANDDRWRRPERYVWFLVGFLAIDAWALTGDLAPWVGLALLCFTLYAYATFVSGGRHPRQPSAGIATELAR